MSQEIYKGEFISPGGFEGDAIRDKKSPQPSRRAGPQMPYRGEYVVRRNEKGQVEVVGPKGERREKRMGELRLEIENLKYQLRTVEEELSFLEKNE